MWEACTCMFPRTLIDGTKANGRLMRRKVKGKWQYRKMTPEEEREFESIMAW